MSTLAKDVAIPGVCVGDVVAAPALVTRVEHTRAAWTTRPAPDRERRLVALGQELA
jgi:hypothetical protein